MVILKGLFVQSYCVRTTKLLIPFECLKKEFLSFTKFFAKNTIFSFFLFIFAAEILMCWRMNAEKMMKLIAEYFKTQPVLKAWIFGSYSRGEQRLDSDIDILILPDKSQHFSLFTLSAMYEDLKNLLGCEVDLITDGGLMSFARESADRDKILIYERAA